MIDKLVHNNQNLNDRRRSASSLLFFFSLFLKILAQMQKRKRMTFLRKERDNKTTTNGRVVTKIIERPSTLIFSLLETIFWILLIRLLASLEVFSMV
jgi:hypothetical protein